MGTSPSATPASPGAVFVTGSTLRHVAVMTMTASVGLIAIFVVDLLSLLYVSRLGRPEATAGVGFATLVLYIAVSINVGLMIAVSALTARAIGAGDRAGARRIASSALVLLALLAAALSAVLLPILPWLLDLLGARGEAHAVALAFLWIVLPSNVLMALGMGLSGVLRAVGDARRAMNVTLAGGVFTAALDPVLIFWAGLGPQGAAIAIMAARCLMLWIGFRAVTRAHRMLARPRWRDVRADAPRAIGIAVPAILTNLANPVANSVFAGILARYGDAAVAAMAIMDRLVPVAFGVLFALSGAVGPILSQNWGAGRHDRMRRALTDSALFAIGWVLMAWIALLAGRDIIVMLFGASGLTADLVRFFCLIVGPMWFFVGLLFVATAAFNNLGKPFLSTAFNWGRATLGTIPLGLLGAQIAGPQGALVGSALGSVAFGLASLALAYRRIGTLERAAAGALPDVATLLSSPGGKPQSSKGGPP